MISSVTMTKSVRNCDLVIFTEEILKGLYPPNFFKKLIFGFLVFFGTLNYGESPQVMYFCCFELFILLFFITKLTVQKNIPQQRAQQRVLPVLNPNITQENLVFIFFSMVENPVKPRITKPRKNLDKQDKIDLEKQTLSSGLQSRQLTLNSTLWEEFA